MSGLLEAPRSSRSPWQWFYGAGHGLRRRYWSGRAARLPRPVISVGNLRFGGSGKTPLVAAIAAHLRDGGHQVCILSRGYGRHGKGVKVVSVGEGPLLGPALAGDEPVLLAGSLPGVAVVVGSERAEAGRHAMQRLPHPPDLFLLDDGFTHVRLARDLDILAFPSHDPFAGGRLLPGGRLREPLAAARHAQAALLTGTTPAGVGDGLAAALRSFGFTGPGFAAPTEVEPARRTDGATLPHGVRVLALAGIAGPERFVEAVRAAGIEIADTLLLADHQDYDESTVARVRAAFEASGADVVLTTSKDRVKLQGTFDLPIAELPIRCVPEAAFWTWLDDRVGALVEAR